jgi:hypothetical protein
MQLLAALMLAFGGPAVTTDHGIPTVSRSLGVGEYVSNVEIATSPDVYPADQFLLSGSFRSTVYVARLFPQRAGDGADAAGPPERDSAGRPTCSRRRSAVAARRAPTAGR